MKPIFVLIGVTLLWSSTFVVTKDLVAVAPPLPMTIARFGFGGLVLLAWTHRRWRQIDRDLLHHGVILGVISALGILFQVFGQVYTTASKASFITSLSMPLTPIFAFAIYRERAALQHILGIFIAVVGLALLTYPAEGVRFNRGDILSLGAAIIYGLQIVEMSRRTGGRDALLLALIQVVAATFTFAICYAVFHGFPSLLPESLMQVELRPMPGGWQPFAEVVYLGVVCTAVTYAGQTWATGHMSATQAAIIFASESTFSLGLAVLVYGAEEWPGTRGAIGAALSIVAVIVSSWRKR